MDVDEQDSGAEDDDDSDDEPEQEVAKSWRARLSSGFKSSTENVSKP